MLRAHWERLRVAKGGFLILHMPHCAQHKAWHSAGTGSKCIFTRTNEQIKHENK